VGSCREVRGGREKTGEGIEGERKIQCIYLFFICLPLSRSCQINYLYMFTDSSIVASGTLDGDEICDHDGDSFSFNCSVKSFTAEDKDFKHKVVKEVESASFCI
jgi:hypothetical protein